MAASTSKPPTSAKDERPPASSTETSPETGTTNPFNKDTGKSDKSAGDRQETPLAAANLHPTAVAATAKISYDLPDSTWKMIVALVEEREGYARRANGKGPDAETMADRVAAVDESLKAFGTSYEQARRQIDERAERVSQGLPADPNAPSEHQKMIDALMEERRGYVERSKGTGPDAEGMADRVAAVDASLRNLGTTPEQAAAARGEQLENVERAPAGAQRSAQQTR
jgi:hypothetical protein